MRGIGQHHPRVYPANYPLLNRYGPDHPAVRVLQVHAEACDVCVAKEIQWAGSEESPVDQSWFSARRCRQESFSAFAYEFLSYDLVLDGWLEMAPEPTESEIGFLVEDQPLMQILLDECEEAANSDGNSKMLPLIAKAREFVRAYDDALVRRFKDCRVRFPRTPNPD